jgi:uncharacterized protein YuzE
MSITTRARAFSATLCLPFLFACGSSSYDGPGGGATTIPGAAVAARCAALRGGAVASPETISVSLSGQFEVPEVSTAGVGIGSFTVNRSTGDLSCSITVTGLSGAANAAHIHGGFAGINGGIIVGLDADGTVVGKFNVPAATVLSAPNLATFLAGGMYVNAHTVANPGGEVRAQIVPGGVDLVRCTVTGDFEVPPVSTTSSGVSYTTVNTTTGAVVVNARTSGFTDANAAHLHQAFAGLNGGIIVPLAQTGVAGTDLWEASATLTAPQLAGFLAGEVYVNVHTPGNPGGQIRSQVVPKDISVLRFGLDGTQEVPAVPTIASAIGYVTVNTVTRAIAANARTSNLTGANAVHVHQAAAGVNGGVIVPLTQPDSAGTPQLWAGTGTLTAPQLTAFLADQTYVNVHTATYPNGEIRGQIVLP